MSTIALTVTPFRNDQEIQQLIDLAYSNSIDDKRQAIQKINQLEARINQLPMGLGSLKHILKAELIRWEQEQQRVFNDENSSLQYACAIAVLKFVDAVSVPYRVHHSRISYRNIAKQVDLPGHIISLRHDIAHNYELPSLTDLLPAIDFSKQWLRKNCLDELLETMAIFSQGSYGELLDIIAHETIQAYVDARLNYFKKRSKKRLQMVDERVEEINKALQMSNGKQILAEVFVKCGNFIMVPNQLRHLDYDSESSELVPSCVLQFWKPIIQLIQTDSHFISIIIDKILTYLTDHYCLSANDNSIINRQRIGWVFYLIEDPSVKLDLCSIFIRLARILQPWFADALYEMVTRMADNMSGTTSPLISEQKRDQLHLTISMFTRPFENITNESSTVNLFHKILPRNEFYKRESMLFKKRSMPNEVPIGSINNEEDQSLEMNIDLSKIDRNFLGYSNKRKSNDPLPIKRIRTSSPSIDPNLFHSLLYPRHHYQY